MKEIEYQISRFIDNDLTDNEQIELFAFMKENKEAREILQDYLKINREAYAKYNAEIPGLSISGGIKQKEKTETKIVPKETLSNHTKSYMKKGENIIIQKYIKRRSPVYFNYILGGMIIIIVLLSFLQIGSIRTDLNDFKGKYEAALFEYKFQSNRLNDIINAGSANQDIVYKNNL